MRRTTKPTTIKRLSMLLAAIMLTFTTAWAQYEDYTLTVIPNYDGAGGSINIRVGYDWEQGGHYVTLNTPYFEQQFNRGGNYHIVGYSYSSTDDAELDIDATILLTENPTTLYAIWKETEPDLILPASLTAIESEAFAGGAFTYVQVPEGVTTIGPRAFADCPKLRDIAISGTETWIDPTAFAGVSNLTIHGADGSYAEFYASKYGFAFVTQ